MGASPKVAETREGSSGAGSPRAARSEPTYLAAVYQATQEEIARLRDGEWRIGYYFIGLAIGTATFVRSDAVKPLMGDPVKWALTMGGAISFGWAIYVLRTQHGWLAKQRTLRKRLESAMGLYVPNAYGPEAIIPNADFFPNRSSYRSYDVILPIAAGILIADLVVLWIVWTT